MFNLESFYKNQKKVFLYFFPLVCFISLSFAYIVEYGFGFKPCTLCLYQRVPYFIVIALGSFLFFNRAQEKYVKKFALIYMGIFLVGTSIAFYHVGVEKGVFSGPTSCSGQSISQTLEELRAKVFAEKVVPCNVPAFVVMKISMAGWNMLFSLILAGVAFYFSLNLKHPAKRNIKLKNSGPKNASRRPRKK